jgi:hypothetical protein
MNQADMRYSRVAVRSHPAASPFLPSARTEFYREEFLKHQRVLQMQREYFSEDAIAGVEGALRSILARLDALCCRQDCDRVLGALLKKFDSVTRLSAWDEPGRAH